VTSTDYPRRLRRSAAFAQIAASVQAGVILLAACWLTDCTARSGDGSLLSAGGAHEAAFSSSAVSAQLMATHGSLTSCLQSVPRLVYRVVVVGGSILGKAFYEAGRQVIASAFVEVRLV